MENSKGINSVKATAFLSARILVRLCSPAATGCLLAVVLSAGCSSLDIDSAKNLGAIGKESIGLSAQNISVSDKAYLHAMDAEAFFHGYAGTPVPEQLRREYQSIQQELNARRRVFAGLGQVYEAFYSLALLNAADGIDSAIGGVSDAVNGYARTLNPAALLSAPDKASITRIAGLAARQRQKRRIAESSVLIRAQLEQFAELLENPLVTAQMTAFNRNLSTGRAAAVTLLWEKGLLDPTPLINALGHEAGLTAGKDALKIIAAPGGSTIKEGLSLVVKTRLERRTALIEQGYAASVKIVRELIARHSELENGTELSPSDLRRITAELQLLNGYLNPETDL